MEEENKKQRIKGDTIVTSLLAIALILMVFNQFQLLTLKSGDMNLATGMVTANAQDVTPKGVPEIYGDELKISYDDVSPNDPDKADKTIEILSNFDRTLTLDGKDLERYIAVGSEISCEYCCGAKSIVFSKKDADERELAIQDAITKNQITKDQAESYQIEAGAAACGCAHSYAMRGLAKYLIVNHAEEYSDEEILHELAKWKTLFFPGQMNAKASAMKDKEIPFSYSNLGSNAYRGIESEKSTSGDMVGGC